MDNQPKNFRYVATKSFSGTAIVGLHQVTFVYAEGEPVADDTPREFLLDWLKRGRIKKVIVT